MKRLVITNGVIYDGLGHPGQRGTVVVEGDKIAAVLTGEAADSARFGKEDRVIHAGGRAVTPGFVDIHRHHDAKPLNDSNFGRIELAQGITTAVAGNCGISMTPRPADPKSAKQYYAFEEPVMGPISLDGPLTYREYMSLLDQAKLPLNMGSMVGTGTVKICVKGFSDTPYTQKELDEARGLIEDALAAGAAGISLGIMYLPECYSTIDEFAYILEPVGRYGRVITTHIRGEGDSMVRSVREVIEIARKVGCALEISHFKSCGMKNWGRDIHTAIADIDKARAEGMDVTCDCYPYDGGSTALTTMLPPVFVAGDMNKALWKLGTPEGVAEFRRTCSVLYEGWDNFAITLGWDRILISGVNRPENEKFLGMRMSDAAGKYGYEDAAALAAHLMHSEGGKTAIINMSMSQDDIDTVARLPYSNFISDSIYAKTDTPHPRMYGAFPKIIREYVRERQLLPFEEALRKMTSQPAGRMKLEGRGRIETGAYADLLVFDPAVFRDNATFTDPARPATGLDYCIVNGQIALEDGRMTGAYAGKNIKAGA